MKTRHTKIQMLIVISIVAALIIFAYISFFHGLLNEFSSTGASLQSALDSRISTSTFFVESMSTYSEKFFKNGGTGIDSEYMTFLRYDSKTDSFSMDNLEGTIYKNLIGNLTGKGALPEDGIDREEINMALCYNDYFSHFTKRMPEIAWVYYTSEQGFINMYPWTPSEDFKYTDELKGITFYSIATPENDPSRKLVWTPPYQDAAGKGLMITLSSPIYSGEVFKGVLSIDFTTDELSRLIQSEYESYIVKDDYSVISASNHSGAEIGILKLSELIKISDTNFQKLEGADYDKVCPLGSNLIYKAKISDAPFTLIIVSSKAKIFWRAVYLVLPEILIGILLIITFIIISNLRRAQEKLREVSLIDPLTGLKNRRYLDAVIDNEIARADRYKENISIASLDLDHFKRVNDTWGHPVGDEVLKLTANVVKSSIRASDVMIRLGGEEFLILMPNTDIDAAFMVSEGARKAIENSNHPIAGKITASFGVIERHSGESYNNMFRRVDLALYSAKNSGRNCVRRYEETKDNSSVREKVAWNWAWECGEASIDAQHRELVDFGNMLIGMSNTPPDEIESLLDKLMEITIAHFDYEESILKGIAYPELESHAEIHRKLVERLMDIRESARKGGIKISSMFSFILDDIIVGHLLEEDIKFFPYMKEQRKRDRIFRRNR